MLKRDHRGADEPSNYYSTIMRSSVCAQQKFHRTRSRTSVRTSAIVLNIMEGGRRINIDNAFSVPFRENEPVRAP